MTSMQTKIRRALGDRMQNSRYHPKKEIITRKVAGETLLVPIAGKIADMERIFALDPVAACIWDAIEAGETIEGMVDRVVAAFDVKRHEALKDAEAFVKELLEAGLIEERC